MSSRRSQRLWLGAFLLALLPLASDAVAGERDAPVALEAESVQLPPPSRAPWEDLVFPRIEAHTQYTEAPGPDDTPAVRASSQCAAAGRTLSLDGYDLARTPVLRWRWRIERGLAIADETSKRGDDFAARVYLLYPFDPEKASTWRRLQQTLAETLYGTEIPGFSVNFVWASRARIGADWRSPYTEDSWMLVLRSGSEHAPTGWETERVDLRELADRVDGLERGVWPGAVALMTDADTTCGAAEASYADFALEAPGEASPRTQPARSGTTAPDPDSGPPGG